MRDMSSFCSRVSSFESLSICFRQAFLASAEAANTAPARVAGSTTSAHRFLEQRSVDALVVISLFAAGSAQVRLAATERPTFVEPHNTLTHLLHNLLWELTFSKLWRIGEESYQFPCSSSPSLPSLRLQRFPCSAFVVRVWMSPSKFFKQAFDASAESTNTDSARAAGSTTSTHRFLNPRAVDALVVITIFLRVCLTSIAFN